MQKGGRRKERKERNEREIWREEILKRLETLVLKIRSNFLYLNFSTN